TTELTADNQNLTEEFEALKNKNIALLAEIEELKRTVSELEKQNEMLNSNSELIKTEANKVKTNALGIKIEYDKLIKENKKIRTDNEKLLLENSKLKSELADENADSEEEAIEGAVPLNKNWNSLSLGTEMYESLFSCKVDTPQVWIDPLVWNIVYAAVPSDYTIPDSKFVNSLSTHVARELLKPTFSPDKSQKLDSFLDNLTQQFSEFNNTPYLNE
ncbi:MAG: hypothetical protein ACQEWW_17735, partial [Bacillota bacterium]